MKLSAWGLVVAGAILISSCSTSHPLEPITFQMDWTHEAEYTGLYVAQDQGFFNEAGLQVTLMEGPAGTDVPGILASGRAEISQMGMTMFLSALERDSDLVAVMAVFQTSPRVLITLADRGIRSPREMEGLKLGVKSASWAALAKKILANAGGDPRQIHEVPVQPSELSRFYQKEVDVWTGFAGSEPVEAELAGHPTTLFFADDYGAGGYDELIVVKRSLLEKNRQKIQRFVRAVARGWTWAADHSDQASSIVDQWQPRQSHQFHELAWKAIRPLIVTGRFPVGWIEAARWPTRVTAYTTDLLDQL